jgi:hypothetical protein
MRRRLSGHRQRGQKPVPPEVLTGAPPPDCTGTDEGAWRLLELFEEFEEFEEFEPLDELEPFEKLLLEELESLDELPEEPELLDESPAEWDDELFTGEADECVEPGSVAATTPATATLAKLTAAVAAFSR